MSHPRSFRALLVTGLSLIALPLVVALITNAVTVGELANRSQNAVYQAAQATQESRRLAESITALERTARQMVILGDRSLLDAYQTNRERLGNAAGGFARLPLDAEQARALAEIVKEEQALYAALSDPGATEPTLVDAVRRFPELAERARLISARSSELIDREVEALRATADQARRVTWWQLLALLPVVAFLAVGFTILIARPIRQIDSAIRTLGGGALNTPVVVRGPQDLEDLGERLEWLRQRLLELEEQKNRFLRQVSHELKTPLTAVREGAELLAGEVAGRLSPQQLEIAGILRQNSVELQKQIEALLGYAASQFHKVAPDLRPVGVAGVIERVAGDQRLALKARGLRLEVSCRAATVKADGEMLRIMLDNLVSNAIKFSPRGGAIRIHADSDGARFVLEVSDEGPGIPREERERIFDPFVQGAQHAAGAVRGTGIGLSVVREHALAHEGSVAVIDSARGAHLRITLPVAADPGAGTSAVSRPGPAPVHERGAAGR